MSRDHALKTWPVFFERMVDGSKTFEIRKDDRDFQVGDTLSLHEWSPSANYQRGAYTDRVLRAEITYILRPVLSGDVPGIADGYCVLALNFESEVSAG